MAGPPKRTRRRFTGATLFFALLSLVLAFLLYRAKTSPPVTEAPPERTPAAPPRAARTHPRPRAGRTPPGASSTPSTAAAPSHPPLVAIVIDDLGNDRAALEHIRLWPFPVSGAVLPALAGSQDAARGLAQSGKDVLLHLPMEPKGSPAVKPGPGVVLVSQSDAEIATTVESDLASVPGAVGVNNHMGSLATADPRVMRAVARVLSSRNLFFLDSRTTDATVAIDAARDARVRTASRKVFLDDVQREDAIEASLAGLVEKARAEGSAIGIGHPYPSTLAVLDRELPRLASRGVRLVRVRDLVD